MKKIHIFYFTILLFILFIFIWNYRFFSGKIIEGASSNDPLSYDVSTPAFKLDGKNSTDKPTNDEMLSAFLSGIYMYITQVEHSNNTAPQTNVNICTKLVSTTKLYFFLRTYVEYNIEQLSVVFPDHFQNGQSVDVFRSMIISSGIVYNTLINDEDGTLKTGVDSQNTCDKNAWKPYLNTLMKSFKNIVECLAFLTSKPPLLENVPDTPHTEF